MDERMLLSGALLVTALALLTEWLLARLEIHLTPPGTAQA
jgi:ABC-type proline/glycine betaine transport system permease subunit